MGDVKAKPRATLAVTVLMLAACGPTANGAAKLPTASEILNKPDQANVKDAHFTLVAHIVSSGVAFDATGDGVIVVKPAQASKFMMTTTIAGQSLKFEEIIIGGKEYDLAPDNPRDGYPLKYASTTQGSTFTATFDRFNTGQQV